MFERRIPAPCAFSPPAPVTARVGAPGAPGPPAPLPDAGPMVDEIADLGGTAPAGLTGVQHLGILAKGKPRLQHVLGGHAGDPAAFHRIADVAARERIGLHQRLEAANLLDDIVRGAAELEIPIEKLIGEVISALQADATRLGLDGVAIGS